MQVQYVRVQPWWADFNSMDDAFNPSHDLMTKAMQALLDNVRLSSCLRLRVRSHQEDLCQDNFNSDTRVRRTTSDSESSIPERCHVCHTDSLLLHRLPCRPIGNGGAQQSNQRL